MCRSTSTLGSGNPDRVTIYAAMVAETVFAILAHARHRRNAFGHVPAVLAPRVGDDQMHALHSNRLHRSIFTVQNLNLETISDDHVPCQS